MKINELFFCVLAITGLGSCDLDREIEIKLPPYEKQLVAECYLERGQPLKVLLMESDPYFDTLRFPFVNNAQISLNYDGITDSVPFFPSLDLESFKFYNYSQPLPVNEVEGIPYRLTIQDSLGRRLEGVTRFLPVPQVDTVEVRYSNDPDSLASVLVWIRDFPGETNYYRVIMNQDSLDTSPVVEFTFTDNGQDGKRFPIGTSYRFKKGSKFIIRLFHIEQAYYDYLRAMGAASRANGNPFAQPATISSPMKGEGFGIFTTLNFVRFDRVL